jgi:hypothetical protein
MHMWSITYLATLRNDTAKGETETMQALYGGHHGMDLVAGQDQEMAWAVSKVKFDWAVWTVFESGPLSPLRTILFF